MNLLFRVFKLILFAAFARGRMGVLEGHVIRSRVGWTDIDGSGFVPMARLRSLTDLGLLKFALRTGIITIARQNGWAQAVQNEEIRVQGRLRWRDPIELRSRMVGWDDCYMCFVHEIWSKDRPIASSRMVARLMGAKRQRVTDKMVLDALGVSLESPPLDASFQQIIVENVARYAASRGASEHGGERPS